MATKEQLLDLIRLIPVPGVKRSLAQMNLVREIDIKEGKAQVTLASTALTPEVQQWLERKCKEAAGKLDGAIETTVSFIDSSPKDINSIKNIIAIMSGKGGVGKSLVSSLVAVALKHQGYKVGILDADITGPSIPRMFGINTRPAGSESGILPVSSKSGIEIMSINLLLPEEDDAVIWRGPLIAGAIKQFWEEVLWGNLDYLIVDLPPGTADAPLTVMQSLPIKGVIIVFTPQSLTGMIVRKAVKMAQKMDKTILGVVENMSYLYLPELKKKMEIFGKSRGEEMAAAAGAPLLARIPIDPQLSALSDAGTIEQYNGEILSEFSKSLLAMHSKLNKEKR